MVLSTQVAQFHWNTGDAAEPTVVSDGPGLPYPNEYVTHTYLLRGDFTAVLETIWQATYTVDGGPSYAVPGTVTTTGPGQRRQLQGRPPVVSDRLRPHQRRACCCVREHEHVSHRTSCAHSTR